MSTLLPFLYQTRTIQRAAKRSSFVVAAFRPFHAGPILPRGNSRNIPFEWDGQSPEIDGSEPQSADRSTITITEERAFRKIFQDIAKRSNAPPSLSRADRLKANLRTSQEEAEAMLEKYPHALRASARAALNLPAEEEDVEELAEEEEDSQHEALLEKQRERWELQKELRDAAADRMEDLFSACSTDEEVGAVMEHEIFSMVKKLGLEEGPDPRRYALASEEVIAEFGSKLEAAEREAAEKEAAEQTAAEQVGQEPAEQELAQETPEQAVQAEANEPPALNMESHGPLYALHLLQGLRALDRDFARPSPLALKVLPRIRELGMASYVLGASVPFYNELATITWRRHGDIRGVLALLRDMQFAGLTPDKHTIGLIVEIEGRLDAMSDGSEGPFSKVLSTMPAYDFEMRAQLGVMANKLEPAARQA